ncbi:hypothetical protein F5Y05DRAFT_401257 [Hypoxylon sp. FL0543]|nr:hypothetical protein F5Y05DRAFT_401257 [Hypoxylon sp. FL0543]
MEHDHVVTINLEKVEYDQTSQDVAPSITLPPPNDARSDKHTPSVSEKSCIVCRKTLLLSYFNCCAICLGIMECRQGRKSALDSDSLPITEFSNPSSPPFSSSTPDPQRTNKPPHCDIPCCRYTHLRPVMYLMVLCEAVHFFTALTLFNISLYQHNFTLLRFSGLLLLQWWQIFVLPRQWACGQSIVAGQLVAVVFMVWFYEPFAIGTVLLKIVFPW